MADNSVILQRNAFWSLNPGMKSAKLKTEVTKGNTHNKFYVSLKGKNQTPPQTGIKNESTLKNVCEVGLKT